MHHVLLDGWSMARLLGETLRDYFASTQNIAHIEIAQARPYRDYIEWLQRQNYADGERFWRQELRGLRACDTA